MDVKLESLIEKIKKEGVQEAQQKSEQIINQARQKEKEIIQKAKKEAERIKKEGEREVNKLQKSSEESLKQSARNLILSVREKLTLIFDNILKRETEEALRPKALTEILGKIIDKWSPKEDKILEVLVSQEDKEELSRLLLTKFKGKAEGKFEIKSSKLIKKGFQVGVKGEDTYYDFSDEGIIESLSLFLNPYLSSLISNKKDG